MYFWEMSRKAHLAFQSQAGCGGPFWVKIGGFFTKDSFHRIHRSLPEGHWSVLPPPRLLPRALHLAVRELGAPTDPGLRTLLFPPTSPWAFMAHLAGLLTGTELHTQLDQRLLVTLQ